MEIFMRKYRVPLLETERLYLKKWSKRDAADLFEYAKDPAVGPAAGWKPHASPAESRMIISECFLQKMSWAIQDKESGKVIGSIGFEKDKFRPDILSRELGYSLSKQYWGRGLMTEAAKRLVAYAFEEIGVEVLSITTGESNLRSRRVIEKCGFTYEGTLRDSYKKYDGTITELRCYSMLREEYAAMKSAGISNTDAAGSEAADER